MTSRPTFSTTSRMSCAERAVTDLFNMGSWLVVVPTSAATAKVCRLALPCLNFAYAARLASRLAAFADLDDFHGIGAARRADGFTEGDNDKVAFLHQPRRHQLVLCFLQQIVAIVSDIFNHQRINIPE